MFWTLPGQLPDRALQRIFELSGQHQQFVLAQTCRQLWQLWHEPFSGARDEYGPNSPALVWRSKGPERL